MTDVLPDFKPVPLWGLTWEQARNAAKVGLAIRRAHWCSPVVIWSEQDGFQLDDDGDLARFVPTPQERNATDWNSQEREE